MTTTTARTVPPPTRRFGFLRRLSGWGYLGAFLLALLFVSPLVWSAVTSVNRLSLMFLVISTSTKSVSFGRRMSPSGIPCSFASRGSTSFRPTGRSCVG